VYVADPPSYVGVIVQRRRVVKLHEAYEDPAGVRLVTKPGVDGFLIIVSAGAGVALHGGSKRGLRFPQQRHRRPLLQAQAVGQGHQFGGLRDGVIAGADGDECFVGLVPPLDGARHPEPNAEMGASGGERAVAVGDVGALVEQPATLRLPATCLGLEPASRRESRRIEQRNAGPREW
jgi:hypothetical protein